MQALLRRLLPRPPTLHLRHTTFASLAVRLLRSMEASSPTAAAPIAEAAAAAAAAELQQEQQPEPFRRKTKAEKRQIKYALKKEMASKKRKQARARHAERWKAMDEEERERIRAQWRAEKEDAATRLRENMATGLRICIDLSFDDSHTDRERRSCAKQLCYVHNALRHTPTALSIHFTSYNGAMAETMRAHKVEGWPVTVHEQNAWEVFPPSDLVYLSPDAEQILPSIDPSKVYVIGGIVDRTVRKGMTLRVAEQHGIPTYRIPVKEYIRNQLTHVLNIDTVVQIVARFVETNDWQTTLTELVPLRKQRTKEERQEQKRQRAQGYGSDEVEGKVDDAESGRDMMSSAQGEERNSGSGSADNSAVNDGDGDDSDSDDDDDSACDRESSDHSPRTR